MSICICITKTVSLFPAEIENFVTCHQACKYLASLLLKYCQMRRGNIWCTQFYDPAKLAKWNFGKSSPPTSTTWFLFPYLLAKQIQDSEFQKKQVIQICVKANLDLGNEFPRSDNLDGWAEKSISTCELWLPANFWATSETHYSSF